MSRKKETKVCNNCRHFGLHRAFCYEFREHVSKNDSCRKWDGKSKQ